MSEKALFIPLKTHWFNEFAAGRKTEEFRPSGGRWNESTCRAGRVVQLTKLGNTGVAIVLHRHDGKCNHSKTVYAGDAQPKGGDK